MGKRGWCDFPGTGGNRKLARPGVQSAALTAPPLSRPLLLYFSLPGLLTCPVAVPWLLRISGVAFCVETSQVSVLMRRATFAWVGQKGASSRAHNFFHKLWGSGTLHLVL